MSVQGKILLGDVTNCGLTLHIAEENLVPAVLIAQDHHLRAVAQTADGGIGGAGAGADV